MFAISKKRKREKEDHKEKPFVNGNPVTHAVMILQTSWPLVESLTCTPVLLSHIGEKTFPLETLPTEIPSPGVLYNKLICGAPISLFPTEKDFLKFWKRYCHSQREDHCVIQAELTKVLNMPLVLAVLVTEYCQASHEMVNAQTIILTSEEGKTLFLCGGTGRHSWNVTTDFGLLISILLYGILLLTVEQRKGNLFKLAMRMVVKFRETYSTESLLEIVLSTTFLAPWPHSTGMIC